jgi:hypothetical protein
MITVDFSRTFRTGLFEGLTVQCMVRFPNEYTADAWIRDVHSKDAEFHSFVKRDHKGEVQ